MFAPDFADAGVALTPDQTKALTKAMADTDSDDRADNAVDSATGLSSREQRLLDAASQTLTAAQLQILKTDQIEQNQSASILRQYMRRLPDGGTFYIEP